MKPKQLLESVRSFTGKSIERQIALQSTALAAVAMLAAYAYGKTNHTPAGTQCGPITKFAPFDPSTCRDVPAVIVYPEPWMAMFAWAAGLTLVLGAVAAKFDRSVFPRYLLAGWLAFSAIVAVSGYFEYSHMGRFSGAYFIAYPATTVVAFGVAAASVAAIANIALRLRVPPTKRLGVE